MADKMYMAGSAGKGVIGQRTMLMTEVCEVVLGLEKEYMLLFKGLF